MTASGRKILAAFSVVYLLLTPPSAMAETAIEGLANASKSYHDGDAAKALDQINEVFSKDKMDNDTTAKALLIRGEIYEKVSKPALAYADYNSAIWLGGLSAAERSRANEGSQRTQASLGVSDGGSGQTAHGGTQAPAQESGGFLGNIFGGDSSKPPAQEAQKSAAAADQKAAPNPSGASASRSLAAASALPAGAAANAETSEDKSYYAQYAALPDETKALAEAKRLAKKLGASLSGRPVLVIKTEAPQGKHALYRVVSGPLGNKAEADGLCSSIKTKGANCMVFIP
jgi:cell division septation protein DedD